MAGPYGDSAQIKKMLATTGTTYSANDDARLDALNATVSLLLEDVLGRSFGAAGPDVTLLHWGGPSDVLLLRRPLRAITTVTVGGTVSGAIMSGGTVYDATMWTPSIVDQDGLIYALHLLTWGSWGAGIPITVTGQWASTDADPDVPADVQYVVNHLVVEHFKSENVTIVTDDGIVLPRRDPWADPIVLKVIDKYQVSNRELVL